MRNALHKTPKQGKKKGGGGLNKSTRISKINLKSNFDNQNQNKSHQYLYLHL